MSQQMQPEPQRGPQQGGAAQPDRPRIIGDVEGMSAMLSFGTNGVVTVQVDILQSTTTYDDSKQYSLIGQIQNQPEQAMTLVSARAEVPYTANRRFNASLSFQLDGVETTLSGALTNNVESGRNGEPIAIGNGTQSMTGSVDFGPDGKALLTIDAAYDGQLVAGDAGFTLKGGPDGGLRKGNVTRLVGTGTAYTAGTDYKVICGFVNAQEQIVWYGAWLPGNQVVSGATDVLLPLSTP